jgi:hypothetical protein
MQGSHVIYFSFILVGSHVSSIHFFLPYHFILVKKTFPFISTRLTAFHAAQYYISQGRANQSTLPSLEQAHLWFSSRPSNNQLINEVMTHPLLISPRALQQRTFLISHTISTRINYIWANWGSQNVNFRCLLLFHFHYCEYLFLAFYFPLSIYILM